MTAEDFIKYHQEMAYLSSFQANHACVSIEDALRAIEYAKQEVKQQTMKDAIEREVKEDAGGYPYIDATELYDYDNDKPLAKAGDRVKLVIIKE